MTCRVTTLLTFVLGTAFNVALIGYGSRRLLGVRYFPFFRTLIAGLLGELARDLLGTVLRQIVVDGVFHADPTQATSCC